jgi:hypothetical protein
MPSSETSDFTDSHCATSSAESFEATSTAAARVESARAARAETRAEVRAETRTGARGAATEKEDMMLPARLGMAPRR